VINRRTFSLAGLAAVAAPALSGCWGTPKHLTPLSDDMLELLALKDLQKGGHMYVRICHWSGVLGPKQKQGDKQAPEGFYVVTAAQMNPNSSYYLSFNIGYPNAYDLAHGRTGAHLMVHGGCLSAGCYAMTDESVEEIFALARESFAAGQKDFPVHAFPFRLTTEMLDLYKENEWYDFWLNLKEGYDHFENTRTVPIVGVENGRYVFFKSEDDVPERFALAIGDDDPEQPRLITGWTN
jgi:murein L,D-transpeptidase YafK